MLAGQPRERLRRRRRTVLGLCRADPLLAETPETEISICLLEDLTTRGPFAPIFHSPADPDRPTEWLTDDHD